MEDWQKPHEQIISQFLHTLNKCSGAYVLKGGTASKQCYKVYLDQMQAPHPSASIIVRGLNRAGYDSA